MNTGSAHNPNPSGSRLAVVFLSPRNELISDLEKLAEATGVLSREHLLDFFRNKRNVLLESAVHTDADAIRVVINIFKKLAVNDTPYFHALLETSPFSRLLETPRRDDSGNRGTAHHISALLESENTSVQQKIFMHDVDLAVLLIEAGQVRFVIDALQNFEDYSLHDCLRSANASLEKALKKVGADSKLKEAGAARNLLARHERLRNPASVALVIPSGID